MIDALAYQEGRSRHWTSLLTSKRFWLKSFVYAAPVALVSTAFVSLFNVDDYFYDNPDELKQIELNQIAYRDSLLDMSNPWNRINFDDPASFLMSLFIGAEASVLQNLKLVINKLDQDKLLFLADILRMVELSDAQRDRFVTLMSTLLQSEAGLEKLPILIELLEQLEKAKAEDPDKETLIAQQELLGQETGEEVVLQKEGEEQLNLSLLTLLTTSQPKALDAFLGAMLRLSPEEYQRLLAILSKLGATRTERLLALVEDLSLNDLRRLISVMSIIDNNSLRMLVDRVTSMSYSKIKNVLELTIRLNRPQIRTLFQYTGTLSSSDFDTYMTVLSDVQDIDAVFSIYENLGTQSAKLLTVEIFDYLINSSDINFVIEILSKSPSTIQKDFVQSFANINKGSLRDLVKVFNRIQSQRDHRRLIHEATYLTIDQREKMIEIFYDSDIRRSTIPKALDIATNLGNEVNKRQLINQAYTMYSYTGHNGSTGPKLLDSIEVSGSAKVDDTSIRSNGKDIFQDLVGQLYDINDRDLNVDLLEVSDDLSDTSLVRGAEVVSDIQIESNDLSKPSSGLSKTSSGVILSKATRRNTRVHRIVNIQRRLDRLEKEAAINTLHDIDTREHRKAAIDMGFYADTSLLKDSVAYTEKLRYRLGDDEGLEANKRMIVVASRVNNDSLNDFNSIRDSQEEYYRNINEARQAGLTSLQNERSDLVSKILKQTTKDVDPFGYKETFEDGRNIIRIVSLYERLDREEPKENRFERTRAAELADALGSSEGLIIGPNGTQGVSREVSQETKLRRIDEYLDLDYEVLWERRVIQLTDRPLIVPQVEVHEFGIPDPERVRRDPRSTKPKVVLVKPQQKTGF